VLLQQHDAQLEQLAGVRQVAQDVSLQPHVWHVVDENPDAIVSPKTISHVYLLGASFARPLWRAVLVSAPGAGHLGFVTYPMARGYVSKPMQDPSAAVSG
jgi:hypothetical protein